MIDFTIPYYFRQLKNLDKKKQSSARTALLAILLISLLMTTMT